MSHRYLLFLVLALIAACVSHTTIDTPGEAISRAESAWQSINEKKGNRDEVFRPEYVKRFQPYTATLANGIWTVRWTVPSTYKGEILETTIRQIDGATSVEGKQVGG
jgi:hypothetical protein